MIPAGSRSRGAIKRLVRRLGENGSSVFGGDANLKELAPQDKNQIRVLFAGTEVQLEDGNRNRKVNFLLRKPCFRIRSA